MVGGSVENCFGSGFGSDFETETACFEVVLLVLAPFLRGGSDVGQGWENRL